VVINRDGFDFSPVLLGDVDTRTLMMARRRKTQKTSSGTETLNAELLRDPPVAGLDLEEEEDVDGGGLQRMTTMIVMMKQLKMEAAPPMTMS
jgi:hypothetical protein